MEKKTLAEIMVEPATVEAIIKKAMEINELLLKVENMPEVETPVFALITEHRGSTKHCHKIGTIVKRIDIDKYENVNGLWQYVDSVDLMILPEVSSFNDVE